ncbi:MULTISPECIES: hypothetical protein [unclassified Flavobacterium]|uniref:hypothetical protein n=1 Tax=unclassified Flavobacterium TaxID=196869 RepID=UPI0025BC2F42|nr:MULTISPECIES: hypothetical protein [unclassified Flavobacterium]
MGDFIFYIHSDVLELDNFSNENIKNFLNKINPILEIGRKLQANVYYSFEDNDELKKYFTDPDFNKDFSKSQANKLDLLLENFKQNKEVNNFFKIHFSQENTSLEHIKLPFLNSKLKNKNLIIFSLKNEEEHTLLMVKSNNDFEKVKINSFNNSNKIWEFINKNLPDRVYNFNSKHGNETTKAIAPNSQKASQLLCTDEKAQELLKNAIFDLRERYWCYNFDEDLQTFIVFPCEGDNPQNKYHAFHIKDDEWDKEIPKSIRKHFKK